MVELNQPGGGGAPGLTLTVETPSGTIDDSNTSFTVMNQPLFIDVNGSLYTVSKGLFASYIAGVITLSAPVGVGGFIQSFYNA